VQKEVERQTLEKFVHATITIVMDQVVYVLLCKAKAVNLKSSKFKTENCLEIEIFCQFELENLRLTCAYLLLLLL
jgi:hypothetical protein